MAKKDDLQAKLVTLGVNPKDFEGKTNGEMEVMIQDKEPMSEEDKKALQETSATASKIIEATPIPQGPRMYSMDEVKMMFNEFKKEIAKPDHDDEEEGPRKHTVRMPRLNNQFIIGFKNLNNDPYFPDRILYSQDIFNDQTKQFVPHTTVVFEDETELTLPIETLFKVAKTVECNLLDRKFKDASERYGNIEVKEMKDGDWNSKGTGNFVKGKANIKIETYVVELPGGKVVEVIRDIVNW